MPILPVHTGLLRHGRFICLCRFRCCGCLYRPSFAAWSTSTHRAAPVCMSCLLSMSKSLLGKPSFSSNKLEANYHILSTAICTGWFKWAGAQVAITIVWLTSNSQLEGAIGRVADTTHTGSFITLRGHLNLLWVHITLSPPMIYTFCYGQIWRISSQLLDSS